MVSRYEGGAEAGEGAKWSRDRRTAWRLDGCRQLSLQADLSLEEAAQIAARLGQPVPPRHK